MYQVLNFEISGLCNAKCPWCVTGNKHKYQFKQNSDEIVREDISGNRSRKQPFIEVQKFSDAIERLLDLELIGKQTCVNLYNWGEPLLHPEFNQIAEILCEKNLLFGISTNASNVVNFSNKAMRNLVHLEISIPGFSQTSYDRVHGFKFGNILSNIDQLIERLKKAGYRGQPNLVYHIYQFNIHEISLAAEFCKSRKIHFLPYVAYLNDYYLAKGYLQSSLSIDQMKNISKDILFYYIDDLLKNKPVDYLCPQYSNLTIDEECNVLTCCIIPRSHHDYSLGSIFTMSKEEILKKKVTQPVCENCVESGLAYWVHQQIVPDFLTLGTSSHIRNLVFTNLPKPFLRLLRNSFYRFNNLLRR